MVAQLPERDALAALLAELPYGMSWEKRADWLRARGVALKPDEASFHRAWNAYCEYLKRAEDHDHDSLTLTAPEFLWRHFAGNRSDP